MCAGYGVASGIPDSASTASYARCCTSAGARRPGPQVKAEFKKTATTDNVRTGITTAEFRKVYEAWSDYRAGRVGRSYIVR